MFSKSKLLTIITWLNRTISFQYPSQQAHPLQLPINQRYLSMVLGLCKWE